LKAARFPGGGLADLTQKCTQLIRYQPTFGRRCSALACRSIGGGLD
jgi:hypothetical protein